MSNSAKSEKKNEREMNIIQNFLRGLDIEVVGPFCQPDPPDAILTVQENGESLRVAIELCDHYHDTCSEKSSKDRGSPGMKLRSFWDTIVSEIGELATKNHDLNRISVSASFNARLEKKTPKRQEQAELAHCIASEISGFVRNNRPFDKLTRFYQFNTSDYPTMSRCFTSLLISGFDHHEFYETNWTCSNLQTGAVGLNIPFLIDKIRDKSSKVETHYRKDGVTETWLLFCATNETLPRAVPFSCELLDRDDEELFEACSNSKFDRIYFHGCVWKWIRRLKPDPMTFDLRTEEEKERHEYESDLYADAFLAGGPDPSSSGRRRRKCSGRKS